MAPCSAKKRTASWWYPAEIISANTNPGKYMPNKHKESQQQPFVRAYQIVLLLLVPFHQKSKNKTMDSAIALTNRGIILSANSEEVSGMHHSANTSEKLNQAIDLHIWFYYAKQKNEHSEI